MKELYEKLQEEADKLFRTEGRKISTWIDKVEQPPYYGWSLRRAEAVYGGEHLKVFYECYRKDQMYDDFVKSCLIPMEYLDSENHEIFIDDLTFKRKEDEANKIRNKLQSELKGIERRINELLIEKKTLQERIVRGY